MPLEKSDRFFPGEKTRSGVCSVGAAADRRRIGRNQIRKKRLVSCGFVADVLDFISETDFLKIGYNIPAELIGRPRLIFCAGDEQNRRPDFFYMDGGLLNHCGIALGQGTFVRGNKRINAVSSLKPFPAAARR